MLLHCASCVYELYLYGTIGAFSSGDLVLVQADEADPSKVVVLLHPSADDSNADGAVSNTSFEGARAFNAVGWRDPDGELVTAAKDIPLGMFRVARPPYGIQENGRLVTLEYVQDDGSFLKSPRRGLSFENPAAKELKFIVHHVATALAYEAALHVQQLVFFACCAGLVEGTNVFLQSITMLQRTKNKSHITYYVSGFMLWLSFLVLRVVFLPLLVYRFYLDMSAKPTKTIDKVSHAYAGMGISAVVGIWMLSCYWFASISKGLLKTLCGTGQKVAQD